MSLMDSFKELESKQKIMLVAIVVLVGIALYMGYSTFFPSNSAQNNKAALNTPTFRSASAPVSLPQMQQTPQSVNNTPPSAPGGQSMQGENTPKTAAPTPEQLALLAQSQQLQEEYVHLVNQYQIAQLEQKLAATNAAIAKQKLSATKTYLETQKLEGNSAFKAANGATKVIPGAMQVKYVGYYQGVWTAMVGSDDNYFEVKVGTRLPDGSTVISISNQGVILNNAGQRVYLAIPKTLD
jgi:type IV pilus biogenesis protein PilP